jgi:prepilin-type N-terminal cleavage/methylation domain-containing protein
MTPALPSSTRIREVWSEGGPFPLSAFHFPACKIFNSKFEIRNSKSLSTFPPSHLSTFHLSLSTPRGCRAQAFSLVELLAVVGIIAILSVAAVPVMRGLGGSQSSRATASILVSALEQARTAAILSGTNAYLALPDAQTTTMSSTNRLRTYAVIRQTVDQDEPGQPLYGYDDFQTNVVAPGWVLLSKWERLPGDLLFSSNRLTALTNRITPTNAPFPGGSNASAMPAIGFTPGGALVDPSGTNGLLFASSNKISNGVATVADRIDISFYSGRVRYTGIVTNTNF